MTLGTLVLMIGAIALVLTLIVGMIFKAHKNWVMTFLQNFSGALFIFSGWVKAIDPLGTAYKMEQYFAEFESTFEATWMSFLAPLFPWLSEYAIGFSVFMIVLEIVLGLMLIIGARVKLTSWLFLLIVGFFTFLTGFTYLTGYVPNDANFFEFSKWGPYVETNMRVTDCGCFGDFLKLKPRISFYKDLVLLVPALYFVFRHKDMHRLFTKGMRNIIIGVSTVGLLVYCLSNYVWDLPHTDFRPFNIGKDVRATKEKEDAAASEVQVIAYKLKNKASGEIIELDPETLVKDFAKYPKAEWEYDQIRSEPSIEATKISDFSISDYDENEITDDILNEANYHFMFVCYKMKLEGTEGMQKVMRDTIYAQDTIATQDTIIIQPRIAEIKERTEEATDFIWAKGYEQAFRESINPLAEAAEKDGYKSYAVVGGATIDMVEDFRHTAQCAYPFYQADDILLKTIVRSNPGVVLWKDGKIVHKWHLAKLPPYEEIKAKYIK